MWPCGKAKEWWPHSSGSSKPTLVGGSMPTRRILKIHSDHLSNNDRCGLGSRWTTCASPSERPPKLAHQAPCRVTTPSLWVHGLARDRLASRLLSNAQYRVILGERR